ncbi:MAG TPA: nickel-binding protein [Candidatus Thermoplasmatota archaeon]|nr:nickel-binding protein [Candidatus Thermoplasmatota archaeon]
MRFAALERFLPGLTEADLRLDLESLLRAAREVGVRPVEVDVDRESGRAVGLFVASGPEHVRAAHERAGVACDEVLEVERWWADLVVPHRT